MFVIVEANGGAAPPAGFTREQVRRGDCGIRESGRGAESGSGALQFVSDEHGYLVAAAGLELAPVEEYRVDGAICGSGHVFAGSEILPRDLLSPTVCDRG
jgi:hypothetical protein